jgi:hypothetical protein
MGWGLAWVREGGELRPRAPALAPALAWVRDGFEFYLSLVSASLTAGFSISVLFQLLVRFLAVSFFLPFLSSYSLQAQISVSVYIRPVCITPFFLPCLFSVKP